MKPGEYFVMAFVLLMLTAFFSIFIWLQIKRIKRNRSTSQLKESKDVSRN